MDRSEPGAGQLQPGHLHPGGAWQAAGSITGSVRSSVVAAFNGGFRLGASHGGYYSEGRAVTPLRDGAASQVLDISGTATVGSWNQEVHMGPNMASVRQNLVMLVDNGQVNLSCATGTAEWGATIGNADYIDRSAFGVTADGGEVYVSGPALSVCTLGTILRVSCGGWSWTSTRTGTAGTHASNERQCPALVVTPL
ncbi:MAG TPA: hypothetical protein VGN81_33610 [Pseudonocardiaceae bacterium]